MKKTFEETLQELNKIALRLEDKSTSLDEGLRLYEQAAGLIDECTELLKAAQGRFAVMQKKIEDIS